jgi:cyclopropane fatty-acyl-phospholipid synthase-like methyltransferase
MSKSLIAAEPDNPWVEYWNSQNVWASSSLWRKQMETFVRLSSKVMNYCQDDKVLDFGCGSGHFAEIAAGRLGSVVCADMSEHYVEICRRKFTSTANVTVARVKPDMSDLPILGTGFTKVVCFSVLHYFSHLDYVVAFVRGMQHMCVSGAKMIIGDIGNQHRTFMDVLNAFAFVLREGMFVDAASVIMRIWLADARYRKIKQRGNSYLAVPDQFLESLGLDLGLKVTTLETQFTVNANYKNLLIEF